MWRFLALDDPLAHRILFRDADSVISRREAGAVEQWIASGKRFHMMRDWGSHTALILAELWGVASSSLSTFWQNAVLVRTRISPTRVPRDLNLSLMQPTHQSSSSIPYNAPPLQLRPGKTSDCRSRKMTVEDADRDPWKNFKPLSAEQARQWREAHPMLSPWRVLKWQVAAGLVLAVVLGLLTGKVSMAWSAGYGVLTVALPAAVFARGLMGRIASINAVTATAGLVLWEMVKFALTVVMLMAAPRLVRGVSWPALLGGLFLALMVYWVALAVKPNQRPRTKTDQVR
jgi:ATP synthase protein I